jgi:SAM-dependent methyltransferase
MGVAFMANDKSILSSFEGFLETDPGRHVLAWEQELLDRLVADVFGYHALQLGAPRLDALRENRMPLRAIALEGPGELARLAQGPAEGRDRRQASLVTRFEDLPFASQSVDLVVMPHVLEFADEPHAVLREVERVLVPEGQVIITGFNPASLWGLRHGATRLGLRPYLPAQGQLIALPRIKDWLKLLSFEANRGRFGCYVPWVRSSAWLERWSFLEKAGDRWWPVLGGVYAVSAVKRVRGMRLVGLVRRRQEQRIASFAPAANRAMADGRAWSVRVLPSTAANERDARAVRG